MDMNLDALPKILQEATSSNFSSVANATKILQESEAKKGYHYALLKVALSNSQQTDLNIRWLAVLCLKNGVERHWRTHGPSPLEEDEKASIRNEILISVSETVQQIALQFSVVVSKIARYDYPKNWPEVLQVLLSAISSMEATSMHLKDRNILLMFRLVMKELSSKQLPNDRRMFSELCSNTFSLCFQTWEKHYMLVVETLKNLSNFKVETVLFYLSKLINIVKAFRSMLFALSEQYFTKLLESLLSSITMFLNIISIIPNEEKSLQNTYQKLLIIHSKVFLDAVELESPYMYQFSESLVSLNKQCVYGYSENKALFQERYIVNCVNTLKAVLSKNKNDINTIATEELHTLIRCLVFSFLPLNQSDLESWEDDAEEFCSEEIGETWKYNLRPSTEVLFLTLIHHHSEQMIPLLLSTLQTINESTKNDISDSTNISTFLVNDAVFTAVGLACNELFDCVDFESWFSTILLPYVQKCATHPSGKIVHRRVLWLIEQWVGAKPPTNIQSLLYKFAISSMERNFDIAVRLAASSALRQVMDDFEFDLGVFTPYQQKCTDAMYMLLEDVKTGDAKMRVLHVFSFVIERIGPQVISCVSKLTDMLPLIWQTSESHNMLRCAVVSTLVNVVHGLRGNHSSMQALLCNVIHTCTDISSPSHVYLLIDGLELWLAFLHNTDQMTENLLQLFNNIYGLLELSSESLKECLEIIECYILLGGETFVGGRHGSDLSLAISSLITDVRDECLVMVARLIETMLKIAPHETPFVFQQYLRDTIQHCIVSSDWTVLSTARLLVVSRLAFQNASALWNLFSQSSENKTEEAILAFLKVVSDRIDSVVEIAQRKMVALACLVLLDRFENAQVFLLALSHVMSVSIQVMYDVCDENRVDTFVTDAATGSLEAEEWETQHSLRTRALLRSDPNHKVSLPAFTRTTLERLSVKCGGVNALQHLLDNSIGSDSFKELQEFLQ